jgi:hypothetical protein
LKSFRYGLVSGVALVLTCMGLFAAPAEAVEFPYILDPELSLTGDCSTSSFDPVPDPDCPYPDPAPTNRPSARFNRPFSIAVDAFGNEYVASYGVGTNGRIDIFDDEGHFIIEFADPHGPESIAVDSKGNLYAFEVTEGSESEVVRYTPETYEPEAGNIKYSQAARTLVTENGKFRNNVAVDFNDLSDPEDDQLLVVQNIQISEYSSAATGNTLLETIAPVGGLNRAMYVAVDSKRRRLYTEHCKGTQTECGIKVLSADAPSTVLKEIYGPGPGEQFFSTQGWLGVAVDEENGHFFVGDTTATEYIYEFDDNYELVSKFKINSATGSNLQMALSNNPLELDPAPSNRGYLFVPIPLISGSVLAYEPPEVREPKVEDLAATNITETEVEIGATVDPEGGDTEYLIESVTDSQFQIDGFDSAIVASSGTVPGISQPQRVNAFVSGLESGGTYHFRVFAKNAVGEDEEESLFATYSDAQPTPPALCVNGALISGHSTGLPDCRAYELVTPPDTNGGSPTGAGFQGDRFGMVQSSPSGGAVSFELVGGSIPGIEATGGYHGDPYLSIPTTGGWSSALVGPNGDEASKPVPGSFSPDQGYDFWVAGGSGSAVLGGQETHYVRYPDGHSELVGQGNIATDPAASGKLITEGGTHIIFETGVVGPPIQLEPNAPPNGIKAVYDRTPDEVTHVVSLLPGDFTPTGPSFYAGASPEGEGIAFTNEGKLYLRLHNQTTYEIGSGATYAGLSEGGTRIFYLRSGDLHAFDTGSEAEIDFTETGDAVPVNVAPSGTRAYFVSEGAITGSGQNPEGDEAQPSSQNLYLSEEGAISFVATVTERDVEGIVVEGTGVHLEGLGNWTEALQKRQPAIDPSRLTADGSIFLFQSNANLTGYDSGEDPQIYRYDALANRLHCISCPPTKTPATGGALLQSSASVNSQAPLSIFSFVPNLTPSGTRAVFESTEAMVSGDTDGLRDVYEWEEDGVGSCEVPGGCVYLISYGHSERDDYLFGQSQSGDDVFFSTTDRLVVGDEATLSVYDARVGGGFAQPFNTACQSEACRPSEEGPLSTPFFPAPESGVRSESGNVIPAKPKRCPRSKKKVKRGGKTVCVRRHKRHRRT